MVISNLCRLPARPPAKAALRAGNAMRWQAGQRVINHPVSHFGFRCAPRYVRASPP